MQYYELNIDGLVGPTHHYAGLAPGNIASTTNAFNIANPQAAALQGLAKMRLLHEAGLQQAVFPPHQRPNLHLLHQLGFTGDPEQQLVKAQQYAPRLLSACYSASSMWAANAATVTPSLDSVDQRVHFTAANLISNIHRHQEADFSRYLLERLFNNPQFFRHHPVLPKTIVTSDEGAANHSRLSASHQSPGMHLFVYGKQGLQQQTKDAAPRKYLARQTLEASEAIARAHLLHPERVVFARQNPDVIDQGVFHNDVIAVANEQVLFIHERALADQHKVYEELKNKADFNLAIIEVRDQDITVPEAVDSYLFNSQLLTMPDGSMTLLAPTECERNERVRLFIDKLQGDFSNPITKVRFIDVKQSMCNGGGPACLRLRILLNQQELSAMHQGILITTPLLDRLGDWVKKHYRTRLHASDLTDPRLIDESFTALDELSQLLQLGSIYPFQQEITC
ncbi:N-succinylarginine dihydrolase [Legionella spiritensis]|uniref:N-succinylarginine dihydrolase n=1 Tax=Legionella spiritensis TaxID=452 RepID=UPI000F6CA591|nr:N-succinylarginine dihydrolase [Legionella spiritensis]VEG90414.1 succinylarginine dihydrolase [Legionella spiritensis]